PSHCSNKTVIPHRAISTSRRTAASYSSIMSAVERAAPQPINLPFEPSLIPVIHIYIPGTPRSGAQQDLATEVTEITEGGGLVFYALCPLCALWLNPDFGVPGI